MTELCTANLLIIDDFALEPMAREPRRLPAVRRAHRARASIVTLNRDTSEWLATFDDVLLAHSAVDRFKNAAYDLVVEGESYRPRLDHHPVDGRSRCRGTGDHDGLELVMALWQRYGRPRRGEIRSRDISIRQFPPD